MVRFNENSLGKNLFHIISETMSTFLKADFLFVFLPVNRLTRLLILLPDIQRARDTDSCVDKSQTSSHEAEHQAFTKQYRPNIVKCLQGQEGGLSWPLTSSPNGYCGRRQQKWRSLFEGIVFSKSNYFCIIVYLDLI
jgi:hypothetical protein